MHPPIALLVFNRPETTRLVFESVREARPSKLLVVADGPRADRPEDHGRCEEVRQIVQNVDWPCDLRLCFREENLGCRRSVAEGLDWVFAQVEQAIILEDDCLPDPSFFPFCAELLLRYEKDPLVGMISGDNFQGGRHATSDSYYFSRHCHIWGWATWRRAWQKMDLTLSAWPDLRKTGWLRSVVGSGRKHYFWTMWLDDAHMGDQGGLKTWDMAWAFACLKDGMKCIIPCVNLVQNIGVGENATHTQGGGAWQQLSAGTMHFPLLHPTSTECNLEADEFTEQTHYGAGLLQRMFYTCQLPIKLRTILKVQRWMRGFFRG